jgi:uncharacterized protein
MSEPVVKAADVLQASRGMLQKQLYVVFTRPHLEFQVDLERRGIMFGAGPFWTDDGDRWEGEGMVIIRAGSLDEARAIAASDPMHSSGARTFTVRPWLLNEGTVTVKITYSDGKRELL